MEGKFIVLEGPDGSGKSTQAEMLAEYLKSKGRDVVFVREPGGTSVGERIREVLRDPTLKEMSVEAELFLYMASRAQLVSEIINPALLQGKLVVADRFLLSSIVYQGVAGGVGKETVMKMGEIVAQGLTPVVTVVLDLDEKTWMNRKGFQRDGAQIGFFDEIPDRQELKGIDFHRKVRDAYVEIASNDKSMIVINGKGSLEQVQQRIRKVIEDAL